MTSTGPEKTSPVTIFVDSSMTKSYAKRGGRVPATTLRLETSMSCCSARPDSRIRVTYAVRSFASSTRWKATGTLYGTRCSRQSAASRIERRESEGDRTRRGVLRRIHQGPRRDDEPRPPMPAGLVRGLVRADPEAVAQERNVGRRRCPWPSGPDRIHEGQAGQLGPLGAEIVDVASVLEALALPAHRGLLLEDRHVDPGGGQPVQPRRRGQVQGQRPEQRPAHPAPGVGQPEL